MYTVILSCTCAFFVVLNESSLSSSCLELAMELRLPLNSQFSCLSFLIVQFTGLSIHPWLYFAYFFSRFICCILCVWMFSCMYVCTPCVCSDRGGQKKALDSRLELEWQVVGCESVGGARNQTQVLCESSQCSLNHWTNSSFLFDFETGSLLSVAPYDLELNYVEMRLLLPNAVQFLVFFFFCDVSNWFVCVCLCVCSCSTLLSQR